MTVAEDFVMLWLHYCVPDPNRQITGGSFFANSADWGGVLHKEGAGNVSCSGASVVGNKAVDGGGAYVVANATVEWACELGANSALSGPAM